ncbi:TetR/AcrR family transcriptional regulator [Actinomadura sp. CNU-125]|uniref:TetR/AcrR family transcriptional regulator n=1 Tax=Actinomadura sp. CNU-125 TaxID=1904961 RepID=UPI001177E166|nr:TetR/AcrR family transcriptional regulator [Actinomadura sp. CNU-125]
MRVREQIIAAALRRLNVNPAASMAELAEAAGVSRATLHRHFAGRDELVDEIGTRALDRWEDALDATGVDAAAASTDPDVHLATVRALLEVFARLAHEHGWALTSAEADARRTCGNAPTGWRSARPSCTPRRSGPACCAPTCPRGGSPTPSTACASPPARACAAATSRPTTSPG